MPGALWVPIKRNYTNRRRTHTDALILHIAVSEAASLRGWFNNPKAEASSHLYVRRDGTIEQYIDLDKISWANAGANSRSITVETQGMGSGDWTDAQFKSLAGIASFVNSRYGVPLVLMQDSKSSSRGVGYHRLGVNPYRVPGGEVWSKSYGKICPGNDRVHQVPGIVRLAQGDDSLGVLITRPKPKPPVRIVNSKLTTRQVKNVQRALQNMGHYRGAVDGRYGPVTQEAVEYYQSHQLWGNLVVDGDWGPVCTAHYLWTKLLQRTLNKWAGTKIAVDGDFGKATKARVTEVMDRNKGGAYRGVVDGEPGPVFCRMLGIPVHP
jgi:hypothetical protein